MTSRDNIIYYTVTSVVFVGIVVCFLFFHNSGQTSNGGDSTKEQQTGIAQINNFAPIIEALSVLGSFVFVIWATCFRKTRRDRIDDLKVEMQVVLSQREEDGFLIVAGREDEYFQRLKPKFRKPKYKMLHRCAYDELKNEGKVTPYAPRPIGV